MSSSFICASTVKKPIPSAPFETIKNAILGTRYSLHLTFVGETRAQSLNTIYRQKSYVPNVLSFPLSESEGEIYICPIVANKEASRYNFTKEGYLVFLFIHGCLHLKGHDHGDTMEELERRFCKRFGVV